MKQVTGSQLHLQGIQEATRSGPVGFHRKVNVGFGGSQVLGSEVSLGLGWTASCIQSGPFTLFLQPKGTGTP